MIKSSNFTLYKSRYSELPDSIVDNERKIAEAFWTTEVVKSDELPFYTRHFMKIQSLQGLVLLFLGYKNQGWVSRLTSDNISVYLFKERSNINGDYW